MIDRLLNSVRRRIRVDPEYSIHSFHLRQFLSSLVPQVCLLVLAGFAGAATAQQEAAQGVVRILSSTSDGQQREGSGFIVGFEPGGTYIATAAHVIEGDPYPKVIFAASSQDSYPATPVRLATDLDIAVLKVPGLVSGTVALPLDRRPVEPTEPLQAIGFPRRAVQPRWNTAAASSNEDGKIVLDKGLGEGHSGGPLLRGGWVVGLVGATESDFAYAVPVTFVSEILASWRVPFKMETTKKAVVSYDSPPEPRTERLVRAPPQGRDQIPRPSPGDSRCTGEIKSLTGANQPVRIAALPSATVMRYLPAGAHVLVEEGFPSSSPRWYRVTFENMYGWVEVDHIELSNGCRR